MKLRNYHIKYIVQNKLYTTQVIDNKKKNYQYNYTSESLQDTEEYFTFDYDKTLNITKVDFFCNKVLLQTLFFYGEESSIYGDKNMHNPYGPAYIEYGNGNKILYKEYWLNNHLLKNVYSDDDLEKHLKLLSIK